MLTCPVEDVEDEEAEREERSGDGVDALGPIHEALTHRVAVVQYGHGGRWRCKHSGPLLRRQTLAQAVAQAVTTEIEASTVPDQVLLLEKEAERKTDDFSVFTISG